MAASRAAKQIIYMNKISYVHKRLIQDIRRTNKDWQGYINV